MGSWVALDRGMLKFNVDAIFCRSVGATRIEGIVRNHDGKHLVMRTKLYSPLISKIRCWTGVLCCKVKCTDIK
ncbi:hypothetical protein GQ457_04G018420 [Hibiscus cannabinus]